MIGVTRYRQITADFTSTDAEVERCVIDAVELLEGYLGRELAEGERTEVIRPDRDGHLWPKVTPILVAAGYEIDGLGLEGTAPFGWIGGPFDQDEAVSVTYTGGWVDQSVAGYDTAATNQPPACITRDLAWAAYRLANPAGVATGTGFPVGATSVSLGDASVSFGAGAGGASAVVQDSSSWWSQQTRGYRYAPIYSAVH